MKRTDGRRLNHEALEQLRVAAIKRVHAGESPEEVIRSIGFTRSRIYEWLAAYRAGGWDALKARKATGRPQKLNAKQLRWIYNAVVGHLPSQYRFEFALWTRQLISELIYRQFKIRLSLSSVGRLLAQLGLTCQKPLFRAWQQNQALVDQWLKKVYPKIKSEAKKLKAKVFFADESGIRSDFHAGTTWAEKGETPIIRVTGQRFSLNMISAISPRGDMRFMIVDGSINNGVFIEFLKRLLHDTKQKIFLIVDGHPTHRSKQVKEFVASQDGKLRLIFLPPYSPELNPDELVWNDVKNNVVGKTVIQDKKDLKKKILSGLRSLQKNPEKVRSFFQEKNTRYAA
jgi:transposase